MKRRGHLFIVSGPSGAGKSALAAAVLQALPAIRFSISHTTRPPRGSEKDGVEYHFVSRPVFEGLIRDGIFLEWAEVYGNLYGTSRKQLEEILDTGEDVLLDVDVQGARSIRSVRTDATAVFIMPPSYTVLRCRLEARKLDKAYVIEQRLKIAADEIMQYKDYDFLIVNDEFSSSLEELKAIIAGTRCRMDHRMATAEAIVATFGGMNAEDAGKH